MLHSCGVKDNDFFDKGIIKELAINISWALFSTYHFVIWHKLGPVIFQWVTVFNIPYIDGWNKLNNRDTSK